MNENPTFPAAPAATSGNTFGGHARSQLTDVAWYHYNPVGNRLTVNRDPGTLETCPGQYTYDAANTFCDNTLPETRPLAAVDLLGFFGPYCVFEPGFYYYGRRCYDPTVGKWLSRDPIGERGGMGLYAFLGNAPHIRIDPVGLSVAYSAETRHATAEPMKGRVQITPSIYTLVAANNWPPGPTGPSAIYGDIEVIGPASPGPAIGELWGRGWTYFSLMPPGVTDPDLLGYDTLQFSIQARNRGDIFLQNCCKAKVSFTVSWRLKPLAGTVNAGASGVVTGLQRRVHGSAREGLASSVRDAVDVALVNGRGSFTFSIGLNWYDSDKGCSGRVNVGIDEVTCIIMELPGEE